MDCFASLAMARTGDTSSRIIRPAGASENMDGITRRELVPAEHHIGVQREIENCERAGHVDGPGADPFHRASMPWDAGAGHTIHLARTKSPTELKRRALSRSAEGVSRLARSHLRRHADRELAVTVSECGGVDLLELDRAGEHALLPFVVLGVVLELGHHFFREQLERLANVLMRVLAGLVEQDHLIDMRGAEAPQFLADRLRRADQAAAQRGLLRLRVLALPLVVLVPHVDGARRRPLPVLRLAVIAQRELKEGGAVGAPARLLV